MEAPAWVVEATLVEKIQGLERTVETLQAELRQAREAALGSNLGSLRLRECVLLYVGAKDYSAITKDLQNALGPVADDAIRHLFVLSKAPVADHESEGLRAAFNHGLYRW